MTAGAPFFRPGGAMEPGSPSYIRRASDELLLRALLAREYVFVLDSRQKGKSSMVAQTIVALRNEGVQTVKIDLQQIGANVTAEQWYAGILATIGAALGMSDELFDFWAGRQFVGPLARLLDAVEAVVLPKLTSPLVIFVDEVDFVRALPFAADEFFAAIRNCFNRRADGQGFDRLTFCLVGVATPSQLVKNADITPFNVGFRVEMSDFSLEETLKYSQVLSESGRDGSMLIRRAYYWLSGHPYLTQLLCSRLANEPEIKTTRGVDELIDEMFLSPTARQNEPNFIDVERRLLESDIEGLSEDERRSQLLEVYASVLRGKKVAVNDKNPIFAAIRLSGVAVEDHLGLRPRNRVYRIVFGERWRRARMPDAELRRQRGAARVAMLRTAAVAMAVVMAVSSGAFGFWRLSNERQSAMTSLSMRGEELSRVASERERAIEDLKKSGEALRSTAVERSRALIDIQRQNRRLRELERAKSKALADLSVRTDALERQTYSGLMAQARIDLSAGHWSRIPDWVDQAAASPYRGWEWGYLALLVNRSGREEKLPRLSRLELQRDGEVVAYSGSAIYSLKGQRATITQRAPVGSNYVPAKRAGDYRVVVDNGIQGDAIVDAESWRVLVPSRPSTWICDVDPIGKRYLIVEPNSLARVDLREIATSRLISSYTAGVETVSARFSPDGTVVSVHGTSNDDVGLIRQWNSKGLTLGESQIADPWYSDFEVAPNAKQYALWNSGSKATIRQLPSHAVKATIDVPTSAVSKAAFSIDGRRVILGTSDGVVRLVETESGKLIRSFAGHRSAVASIAAYKDGERWASIDEEGYFREWRLDLPSALLEHKDHSRRLTQIYVTANGRYLVSGSQDGTIVSRDLKTGMVATRTEAKDRTAYIARAGNTNLVYWAKNDGTYCILDPATLKTVREAKLFNRYYLHTAVLPGAKRILAESSEREFALLDATTLRVISRFKPKKRLEPKSKSGAPINDTLAFSHDGRSIAFYLMDVQRIQVMDTETGLITAEWDPGDAVLRMTFVNGSKQLALTMANDLRTVSGKTIVRDARTGKTVFELEHLGRTMSWLEFAPRTRLIAGLSVDGAIFVWDVANRELKSTFVPSPPISIFSFSPDGKRLVTNDGNGRVRVWDTLLGREHLSLAYPGDLGKLGARNWAGAARFTEDGRRIVLSSPDGWTRLWDSAPFN